MVYCFNRYNKLKFLICLTENCEQNFLGGEKSTSFQFVRSFMQANKNSKGSEIMGGGGNDFGIRRAWEGVEHFRISKGKGD